MTRKDFILVAKAIGSCNISPSDKMEVFHKVGNAMKTTNTNFSETKYVAFCNKLIQEEVV